MSIDCGQFQDLLDKFGEKLEHTFYNVISSVSQGRHNTSEKKTSQWKPQSPSLPLETSMTSFSPEEWDEIFWPIRQTVKELHKGKNQEQVVIITAMSENPGPSVRDLSPVASSLVSSKHDQMKIGMPYSCIYEMAGNASSGLQNDPARSHDYEKATLHVVSMSAIVTPLDSTQKRPGVLSHSQRPSQMKQKGKRARPLATTTP